MYIKTKNSGFSLIELIVTMAIVGIISLILINLLVSISQTLQETRVRKQLLMDGYNATMKFVREFELIPEESELTIANIDQVQFNTVIGGVTTAVYYKIVGSELQRSVNGGTAITICNNVTGYFQYNQQNHNQLTPPLNSSNRLLVRHARLVLIMLDSQGNQKYTYSAVAHPENYRFSGGGS